MRKVIGGMVLVAGVAGLGWYGSANNAQRMQAAVAAGANAVATTATHILQSNVSGRDIIAVGQAQDQTEFAVIETAFMAVDGRRVVDMSGVTILPVADPFEMTATRSDDGTTMLTGTIGSDADRAVVANEIGDLAAGLTLSSGVPDAAWVGIATNALSALSQLKSGEMSLSDQTLTLSGLSETPFDRDVALETIGALPDGYTLLDQIEVEDDGTPLRLMLTLADGAVTGTGKVPADMTAQAVTDTFANTGDLEITEAGIVLDDGNWADFARSGIAALSAVQSGVLTIEDTELTLTGTATPDGIANAETALDAVAVGYTATLDLGVFDDGTPFNISMEYDGRTATSVGKYPEGFIATSPSAVELTDTSTIGYLVDENAAFVTNAEAGTAALGLLESGTMSATSDEIIIAGVAMTPATDAAVTDALNAAVDGTTVTQTLTYIDDGSPAAWTFDYTATGGAELAGKMPDGLTPDVIMDTTGLREIDGAPTFALVDDNVQTAVETLGIASEYLPETEALSYATQSERTTLDIVLSPGVNADLVAADLAERLPANVDFTASSLDILPNDGDTRVNQATMLRERFQFGNWLPILTFATVPSICNDRSQIALRGDGVNFLSGSARLDAKSNRAINALAAIAQRCVNEGGLSLEIGGHTDNTGSVIANELLSENRAQTVRDALIERGVDGDAVTAVGYGQAVPIADNDTQGGRAANRRTEIKWSE